MNFQIPQFIETEDKIIGPFTLKQFLYVAATGLVSFLLFFVLEFWLWVIIAGILMSIGLALAMIKINGRPLTYMVRSAFRYIWSPHAYVFRPTLRLPGKGFGKEERSVKSGGGLKHLWESLMTSKGVIPHREEEGLLTPRPEKTKERYELVRKVTGESEKGRRIDYR